MLKPDFHPTRLIYVADSNPRLVLSDNIKGFPEYATLSHCWGTVEFLTLRQDNLHTFTVSIPAAALPQTFQDAIKVVRALGLRYLWIDSLCIMQDKECGDWAKEASKMTQVYGSSTINIAATAAANGSEGLFRKGSEHRNCSFFTSAKIDGVETSLQCVPKMLYLRVIASSPLAKRGWVLQERLLAPRTVHFSKSQVFWECNKKVACESFPNGLLRLMKGEEFLEKKPVSQYLWEEIVQLYSHGQLTVKGDKLVAIAGVAREFAKSLQDADYFAGLWAGEDFIRQLCWVTRSGLTLSGPYQGPTWSWSSVNSRISFPPRDEGRQYVNYVQLLDKDIKLRGPDLNPDPFGAVLEATIFILCDVLYPMDAKKFNRLRASAISWYPRIGGVCVSIHIFGDTLDNLSGSLFLIPCMSKLKDGDRDAHFMDLCSSGSFFTFRGLILKRADSGRRGQYERVGCFRGLADQETTEEEDSRSILQDTVLPESAYERITIEGDGNQKYAISII